MSREKREKENKARKKDGRERVSEKTIIEGRWDEKLVL